MKPERSSVNRFISKLLGAFGVLGALTVVTCCGCGVWLIRPHYAYKHAITYTGMVLDSGLVKERHDACEYHTLRLDINDAKNPPEPIADIFVRFPGNPEAYHLPLLTEELLTQMTVREEIWNGQGHRYQPHVSCSFIYQHGRLVRAELTAIPETTAPLGRKNCRCCLNEQSPRHATTIEIASRADGPFFSLPIADHDLRANFGKPVSDERHRLICIKLPLGKGAGEWDTIGVEELTD